MELNLFLGICIIIFAYGFSVYLIFYSKWSIELIARKKLNSVREIIRELKHGK